jgi:Protein of unknown function (DUF4238)
MFNNGPPKRRHHHVWQKYLKPWTTDGAIWCLQDGRIFSTGTANIAVEKDFYKLRNLRGDDIKLLQILFGKAHPLNVKNHAHLLNRLMMPFQIAEWMRGTQHYAKIVQHVDVYASNVLEDYHAGIEAWFIPSLEGALNGDISFYHDDDRCIPFLHYLCTQYMRTRGIKERTIALCNNDKSADLTRVWNIIIHMAAFNIGASLFLERRRRKLILVRNRTDVPFITGDQPAIDLKGTRPQPPENLSIYYPISPRLALLLADADEAPLFPAEGLTAAQASLLNRMLFDACYQQVFAQSEESLKALHQMRSQQRGLIER